MDETQRLLREALGRLSGAFCGGFLRILVNGPDFETQKMKKCAEIPLRVRWFGGSVASCPRELLLQWFRVAVLFPTCLEGALGVLDPRWKIQEGT